MKYAGETLFIVVNEGEIVDVHVDEVEAQEIADCINEGNVDDEVREAGYEPDELTDDEMAGFAFSAGYNSGYAYCEEVHIPEENEDYDEDEYCENDVETEESTYYTSGGDEFTYGEIIRAYEEALAREELDN